MVTSVSEIPVPRSIRADDSSISMHARASEVLKECLMSRFGSIVEAYEWFDVNRGGHIDYSEFEKMVFESNTFNNLGPTFVRSLFSALDREGKGRVSLSEFLSQAVHRLSEVSTPLDDSLVPESPSVLSAGRRALRSAALVAFRNGRYNDAVVSAHQALGISNAKSLQSLVPHRDNLVEFLLLAKCPGGHPQILDLIAKLVPPNDENHQVASSVQATLLASIAELFVVAKKVSIAESYFVAYLALVNRDFGSTLVYSDALTIVGSFYLRIGRFVDAIECTRKAKAIRAQQLPAPHARLADALNNLATCLKAGNDCTAALDFFSAALQMRIKLFGAVSVPVADTQFSMATTKGCDRRLALAQAAHATRLKLLGAAHPDALLAAAAVRQYQTVRQSEPSVRQSEPSVRQSEPSVKQSEPFKRVAPLMVEIPVMKSTTTIPINSAASEDSFIEDEPATKTLSPSRKLSMRMLDFPDDSPFRLVAQQLGPEEFLARLAVLDVNLIEGRADFDITAALPRNCSAEVKEGLKKVFAKKLMETPNGAILSELFVTIKRSESEIKTVFAILNAIYGKIEALRENVGSELGLDNFSAFIHSRTANVSLISCLLETLSREKPDLIDKFLYQLALLPTMSLGQVGTEIAKHETALKSLRTIGTFDEKIQAMEDELEIFAQGMAVLCSVFKISSEEIGGKVSEALELLEEFYELVEEEWKSHSEASSQSGESSQSEESSQSGESSDHSESSNSEKR